MRRLAAYGLTIAAVAASTALALAIGPIRLKSTFILFTVVVMGSTAFGGVGPGILSVLLSCWSAFYFLFEPIHTFRFSDPFYSIPLVLFGVVGFTIMWGVALLKRAMQQTEETRERFHRAFVDARIGFALTDERGGITEVNRAFCEITGYAEDELLGKELRSITHPQDVEQSARSFNQVATREVPSAIYEKRYLRKDGSTVWVRVSAALLLGPGGKSPFQVIALIEDITESKRLAMELGQAQKMEAIGRLAGGVAHDFNNLLTVIGGYSRMLLEDGAAAGETHEPIRQIAEAADRAAALTGQLLAFSRPHAVEPRDVDLNGVVANVEPLLRRLLGEDVEVVLSLDPACGRILADPNQIEQVIINLAVNARDAMPGHGRLAIETAGTLVDEALASRHIGLAQGEYAQLCVSDTGCGMTAEVQAHLFEPFFTTKEAGKGTGLGLSIVYGIVRQTGGKIQVYSEVGKGTAFKLFFPKLQAAAESEGVLPAGHAPRSGTETILIVEDEESVREYVRAVLGERGYTLLEAADGVEALEVARNCGGEISLLLTDVIMPQMSGPQLASRLRELRPGIKVLYMSGYMEVRTEEGLCPSEGVIQKPFSPAAVAERVRAILDAS